jgi:hypothetical protein
MELLKSIPERDEMGGRMCVYHCGVLVRLQAQAPRYRYNAGRVHRGFKRIHGGALLRCVAHLQHIVNPCSILDYRIEEAVCPLQLRQVMAVDVICKWAPLPGADARVEEAASPPPPQQ